MGRVDVPFFSRLPGGPFSILGSGRCTIHTDQRFLPSRPFCVHPQCVLILAVSNGAHSALQPAFRLSLRGGTSPCCLWVHVSGCLPGLCSRNTTSDAAVNLTCFIPRSGSSHSVFLHLILLLILKLRIQPCSGWRGLNEAQMCPKLLEGRRPRWERASACFLGAGWPQPRKGRQNQLEDTHLAVIFPKPRVGGSVLEP